MRNVSHIRVAVSRKSPLTYVPLNNIIIGADEDGALLPALGPKMAFAGKMLFGHAMLVAARQLCIARSSLGLAGTTQEYD